MVAINVIMTAYVVTLIHIICPSFGARLAAIRFLPTRLYESIPLPVHRSSFYSEIIVWIHVHTLHVLCFCGTLIGK